MIIYTVFDASESEDRAFTTKREAIAHARECSPGTEVIMCNAGVITRARLCAVFNHEGWAVRTEVIYTSPKERP